MRVVGGGELTASSLFFVCLPLLLLLLLLHECSSCLRTIAVGPAPGANSALERLPVQLQQVCPLSSRGGGSGMCVGGMKLSIVLLPCLDDG